MTDLTVSLIPWWAWLSLGVAGVLIWRLVLVRKSEDPT